MSDNIEHIDLDSDEYLSAPAALRDHVRKLQEANKNLSGERDQFRSQVQAQALGGVLTGFKNPERVKRDLLSDKVDPLDSEAVNKWLEQNAGDYARGEATPTPQQQSQTNPDAEAYNRLNGVEVRSPADMSKFEAVQAEITPDMDGAAIKELYRKHGI